MKFPFIRRSKVEPLLRDARYLLMHPGSHVRRPDEPFGPCEGCDIDRRIGELLDGEDVNKETQP